MITLPKWPAFHVEGETVSKETAMDFIVRTDSAIHRYMSGNDKQFKQWFKERTGLNKLENFSPNDMSFFDKRDIMEEFKEQIGYVDLDGDIPSSNISSAVIHGPCGFINADGTIRHKHNIGKWPDFDSVYLSLQEIVGEWEVKFMATLYDVEACELERDTALEHAIVTFVSNGKDVSVYNNNQVFDDICFVGENNNDEMGSMFKGLISGNHFYEQGVPVEDLETYVIPRVRNAVDKVMEQLAGKTSD